MTEHQARLAETIRRTAAWRRAKADEFPDWPRENMRSAHALHRLANFVEALVPNDGALRFRHVTPMYGDDRVYFLPEEAIELLRRFGLNQAAWRDGPPSEVQVRKLLQRVDGAMCRKRAAENRDTA